MRRENKAQKTALKEYLRQPPPELPPEIRAALAADATVTLTPFGRKEEIPRNADLQRETGFSRFPDGSFLVAMTCPMPGVTPEMVRWWFGWHPRQSLRYRIWFPGEHYGITAARRSRARDAETRPEFQPDVHYPVERIGRLILPLKIAFVSPESFGFSPSLMRENDIPLIVCGHVGAVYGLVPHTEMAHIFRQTEDGLMLVSRFWLGQTLQNPLLRRAILTDETARGMAAHCCVEYRNLARILPELYRAYGGNGARP